MIIKVLEDLKGLCLDVEACDVVINQARLLSCRRQQICV